MCHICVCSNTCRHWTNFTEFCANKLQEVKNAEDVEKLMPDLPADFPDWIALWIMDK